MLRLLIADDEVIERKVLYKTLQKNIGDQCVIFQAENGRQALRVYEEEKIQIAILDIEMPGINGIEAAQKIREKDKECCIIFLTAFDEFSYAKKAITVRALDYLLKPYDEQELMLVVEEAMRLAAEYQANRQAAESQTGRGQKYELPETALPAGDDMEDGGQVRLSKVTEIISHYIETNYMYDISMQDLARHMNYSEAYFCKLFKQCFNKNFTSYLTEYRVEEAKRMLAEPTVNVKDIGRAVGYSDSNYFAKVFKRITGQSPTEYRLCIFQRG
ncbi:response regulator [Clostridiales bacterium TF09-2AC]|uniref:response regulator transcription factor n=1 Tax=Enterocloster hominis (ex Hitch et al. 2024) TaxID=1917870 RepID=UPI000E72B131|nr:response regulator [Lachnoclostridium pacaense]MCC2875011.1 response regulator [Lachnoclostridium pacaense]RJW45825.1 response regulator [Clostridiales bacterium TF09-2AC]